jgi:hypothetical protein
MVKSKLYPQFINYDEFRSIDTGDVDYSTIIYDYQVANQNVEIALGKEKHTYSKYNIVYYSIYLIINDAPISRIGIFEIDSNKLINSIDDDGAIDLQQGKILIFVDDAVIMSFIGKNAASVGLNAINGDDKQPRTGERSNQITAISLDADADADADIDLGVEVLDEPDDVMRLNIDLPIKKRLASAESTIENTKEFGIFTVDKTVEKPPLLPNESEADSDMIKREYEESLKTSWIEKFTRNNNYSIADNEGGGDCFFAVIRDAFHQIGYNTSVSDIRDLLSREVDDSLLQESRTLYLDIFAEYQSIENEMKAVHKKTQVLKKNSESIDGRSTQSSDIMETKQDQQRILTEANALIDHYKKLSARKKDTKQLLHEFEHMKDIDTIDKMRTHVKSSRYWADTWAISTLERLLNIKVIILSEEAFKNGDKDSVMQCGQLNDTIESNQTRKPDYYIITSYTGNHYTLVEYKNKRIYRFVEIPYDIKTLIVNKCLERNAGPYHLIQDFRDYKSRLGIDPEIGANSDNNDDYLNNDIYDNKVVFLFHSKSHSAAKPGKGSGEKILLDQMVSYIPLYRITDWRRKLSDEWMVPFSIDGHRWNSVSHYYLGSQYKKGYPDFYLQFSMDSESELSSNVDMAIAASSKSGKYKAKLIRPTKVNIDPDFYEIGKNNRSEQERYAALTAKFTQNQDMKQLLMETQRAKLVHFIRGREPEMDVMLMKLRKELA